MVIVDDCANNHLRRLRSSGDKERSAFCNVNLRSCNSFNNIARVPAVGQSLALIDTEPTNTSIGMLIWTLLKEILSKPLVRAASTNWTIGAMALLIYLVFAFSAS